MNWLGFPTLLLGFATYALGLRWSRRPSTVATDLLSWCVVMALAVPAFLYAGYYSKFFGEPLWLYQLRSLAGSELLAGFGGFAAGWTQVRLVPKLGLSRLGSQWLLPLILVFVIALPYLKPIFRPLKTASLQDRWQDGACLQSSFATCGPASAATVLKYLGTRVSERELAEESFSCASGTENWYLARALRQRGFNVTFAHDESLQMLPAIVGVRMKNLDNSGHFIAILERRGDQLLAADPMEGLSSATLAELRDKYYFTGFSMVIDRSKK